MRVIQAVPTVAHEASGPSAVVPALARALAARGTDVTLMTMGGRALPEEKGFSHRVFPPGISLPRLARSPALARALMVAAVDADILHSHGLWTMINVAAERAARRSGTAFVVSPHGTLSAGALAFSPRVKGVFWRLFHRRGLGQAACFCATSEEEGEDIRRAGLTAPVAVIPNGVDLPGPDGAGQRTDSGLRRALFLARLHPVKGLPILLDAWAGLTAASSAEGWELRIVGPDERGHRAEMEALVRERGIPRVTFAGPRYGAEKWQEYRAADLYVLPTRSENFGVSVAEALVAGTPVVTTTGAPWSALPDQGCGWWVEPEAGAIARALGEAMAMPPAALAEMGARGRTWAEGEFGWSRIAADVEALYSWILAGRPAERTPGFVRPGEGRPR